MKLLNMLVVLGFVGVMAMPCDAAIGTATIKATKEGSQIVGSVSMMETIDGLQVEVSIANVPPGKHGLHFHEKGDCSDEGKAAGGHFNPESTPHGFLPKDGMQHAHGGDMGNIDVGPDGTGKLSIFLKGIYLAAKDPKVAGLSVVLHEKEDDFGQPTGNAGGRIGCGIIMLEDENSYSAEASDEAVDSDHQKLTSGSADVNEVMHD